METRIDADTALIGVGPAGFALLAAAESAGALPALIKRGLLIVDSSDGCCTGSLRRYQVTADTPAKVFQETLEPLLSSLPELRHHASVRQLMARPSGDGLLLSAAAAAIQAGTDHLLNKIQEQGGRVLRSAEVTAVSPQAHGLRLTARDRDGGAIVIQARRTVFATGGTPATPPEITAVCPGAVHSDRLLSRPTLVFPPDVQRLAIIGSSHSAFAALARLLAETPFRDRGEIVIYSRQSPKVTYESAEDARQDGATFTEADVCPQTGRVFRFGGLRAQAAETFKAVRDGRWPRVTLLDVSLQGPEWPRQCLDADLVVAATGYRSRTFELLAMPGGRWDAECRSLDPEGNIVPGMYGIGLATRPRVLSDGGEPSYRGAVDGVWFYERVVGPIIVEQLLGDA